LTTIESLRPAQPVRGFARLTDEWLEPVARVTVLVVLAEALLLRGATRVFIHIPGVDVTSGILGGVADFARLAFRMAVPLTFVLLLMLVVSMWESGARLVAVLVAAFLVVAAGGRAEALRDAADLILLGLVAAVAIVVVVGLEPRWRVPVATWSAAFLMAGLVRLLDQSAADGVGLVSVPWLGGLAETVALAAFATTPLLLRRRPRRLDLIVAVGVAVFIALALGGAEAQSAAKILGLWNLGWAGGYPVVVYAVAIGALVMTVTALVRNSRILAATSLVLMGAAGFGLFSSYQTALLVTGLVLISTNSEPTEIGAADAGRSESLGLTPSLEG